MDDDKRLQAAGALAAIAGLVILVVQFSSGRAAPKASGGPAWYSRVNPFGSAPSERPAGRYEPPAAELAPPERVMTNAAARLFSSPTSAGSAGGLAGAEPPASERANVSASFSAPRLSGTSVDIPGGGRAPTSGSSAAPAAPPQGVGRGPSSSSGGFSAAARGPRPGGGPPPAGGAPGGETAAAAAGAGAFSRAAGVNAATGSKPGVPRLGAMGANGVSMPKTEALKETAALSGSSGGGGGGGGGGGVDGGGGGGGGGGGSGGMGGAVPGGKPKESAGKPAGVDAGAGAAGAAGAAAGGSKPDGSPAGGINAGGVAEVTTPNSQIGAPQVGSTTTIAGAVFRSHPEGEKDVPTTIYVTPQTRLIGFTAKLAIDADGAGGAWRGDKTGQPRTSLLYKNGDSLNPSVVPFIVVPPDFRTTYKGVELGDYAAVSYRSKTVYAIIGDHGPAGVLGEGSISLAAGLGINTDPNTGGTNRREVRYLIAPGSKDRDGPPRDAAAIQARGAQVFDAAGAPVR